MNLDVLSTIIVSVTTITITITNTISLTVTITVMTILSLPYVGHLPAGATGAAEGPLPAFIRWILRIPRV